MVHRRDTDEPDQDAIAVRCGALQCGADWRSTTEVASAPPTNKRREGHDAPMTLDASSPVPPVRRAFGVSARSHSDGDPRLRLDQLPGEVPPTHPATDLATKCCAEDAVDHPSSIAGTVAVTPSADMPSNRSEPAFGDRCVAALAPQHLSKSSRNRRLGVGPQGVRLPYRW